MDIDDDDEFGDLYSDVLRPLSIPSNPPSPSDPLPIPAADPIPSQNPNPVDALAPAVKESKKDEWNWEDDDDDDEDADGANFKAEVEPRVLEVARVSGSVENKAKVGAADGISVSKTEIGGDLEQEPVIPGLYTAPAPTSIVGDDWDSDSDDDLQIVLNDSTHGPMGGRGEYDDDEDLVIVADEGHGQGMEEQDWGEGELQAGVDGEKKEGQVGVKTNGGIVAGGAARIGYSGHGFNPQHHSMFKYVRPGAPAVGPVGPPGQIRPPQVGPNAGRGRGDWRPAGRGIPGAPKSFHSGYGPGWSNTSRGFGGGLDFTLPSHKTIFDVDIESFEEKPWRYPEVDISDYFNFGLDEDNWKEYFKQLDQLRLESTMQSKIRVYEGGRAEQNYDPDLPPELVAATGHHDISAENMQHGKIYNGQSDLSAQGSAIPCMRNPFPPGRAIQVETGYGERLPSIDTRPPRIRDADAIIEIVLQDPMEDSTVDNSALEQPEKDIQGRQLKDGHDEGDRDNESEYFDRLPQASNGHRREMGSKRIPDASEGDNKLHFPPDSPQQYHPNSRVKSPIIPAGSFGANRGGRSTEGPSCGRYSSTSGDHKNDTIPSRNAQVNKYRRDQKEKHHKVEGSQTPEPSNSAVAENDRELSTEPRDSEHKDMTALGEDSVEIEGDEASDLRISGETFGERSTAHHSQTQKLSSRVEQAALQNNGGGGDDEDDDQRDTNSDNSRAKSGSSNLKRHASDRRRREEEEPIFRRKDDHGREGRYDMERNRMGSKGREAMYNSYPHRDWESNPMHPMRGRNEVFERPRETEGIYWQRREDDFYSRRMEEETGSRIRSKVRVSDSFDGEKIAHPKKRLDDGEWRGHNRESGVRLREKDGTSSRRDPLDDHLVKRRKDEEHSRRERSSREDSLYSYRAKEEPSRRKRERDDNPDPRRREDSSKVREKAEDHHSSKHKEDRKRLKQPHEDPLLHRERGEGQGGAGNGRAMEEKTIGGCGRNKIDSKISSDKEHQHRERRQHSEQSKRGRDDPHAREKHYSEERSSRHERLSIHSDRPSGAADCQQMSKERDSEGTRKSKDTEGSRENSARLGKRRHEDRGSYHNEKVSSKGTSEQEGKNVSVPKKVSYQPHSPEKHTEGLASDDESQLELKRGRSKLERWTSHKEGDYTAANSKQSSSSASSKVKEVKDTVNFDILPMDEMPKTEGFDVSDSDPKGVDGDDRDQQLETMAKLKRRSERFRLPMPVEKDVTLSKRLESDALPTQMEAPADTEVKPERPPRKRRWTSG